MNLEELIRDWVLGGKLEEATLVPKVGERWYIKEGRHPQPLKVVKVLGLSSKTLTFTLSIWFDSENWDGGKEHTYAIKDLVFVERIARAIEEDYV